MKQQDKDRILAALAAVQQVIENTYAHDEDGDRTEEEPEFSAADIVEQLCNLELIVDEAAEIVQGGVN